MLLYSCVGSGYFAETHSPENLAKVKYTDMSRRVVVSPLLDGDVQVEIQDLCLSSESRAVSNVHIAGAHSIHLVVRDKVCDTYGFRHLRPERAILTNCFAYTMYVNNSSLSELFSSPFDAGFRFLAAAI